MEQRPQRLVSTPTSIPIIGYVTSSWTVRVRGQGLAISAWKSDDAEAAAQLASFYRPRHQPDRGQPTALAWMENVRFEGRSVPATVNLPWASMKVHRRQTVFETQVAGRHQIWSTTAGLPGVRCSRAATCRIRMIDATPYMSTLPHLHLRPPRFSAHHPVERPVRQGLFVNGIGQPFHNFFDRAGQGAPGAAERSPKEPTTSGSALATPSSWKAGNVPPSSLRRLHVYFPTPRKIRQESAGCFAASGTTLYLLDIERTLQAGGDSAAATVTSRTTSGVIQALIATHPCFQDPAHSCQLPP